MKRDTIKLILLTVPFIALGIYQIQGLYEAHIQYIENLQAIDDWYDAEILALNQSIFDNLKPEPKLGPPLEYYSV